MVAIPTIDEINKHSEKYTEWSNVFSLANAIKMEIYNRGNIKITAAAKLAYKDPRYLAAKAIFDNRKKKNKKGGNDSSDSD